MQTKPNLDALNPEDLYTYGYQENGEKVPLYLMAQDVINLVVSSSEEELEDHANRFISNSGEQPGNYLSLWWIKDGPDFGLIDEDQYRTLQKLLRWHDKYIIQLPWKFYTFRIRLWAKWRKLIRR